VRPTLNWHFAQDLRKKVLVDEIPDPELFQQKDQRLNMATTQLQIQLPHLMHWLVVQEKTEQKKQARFEKHRQLLDPSNEQQAAAKVENVAAIQQSS
jgi:beta-galactosidase beta subunit